MLKKTLCVLLTLALAVCVFAGCKGDKPSPAEGEEKPVILTTIFPLYDWTRAVLGDKAESFELSMLMDSGVDLHSFQPTAEDIMKIATCDLFIYVGGESDAWVEDVLAEAGHDDLIALDLMEALGDRAKEEELKEGMEDTEEEAEAGEEEGPEMDEHIWLSLKNAALLCNAIAEKAAFLSPADADAIAESAKAYISQLEALDAEFAATVAKAPVKTVLFGDRFPFLYLTADYGLDYYAAFKGCSAESEASFATISKLASKVDELGLHAVLQIETADGSIANTVIENTKTKDQKLLTMHSLQSITSQDISSGVTYLSEMQKNLEVLTEALQ